MWHVCLAVLFLFASLEASRLLQGASQKVSQTSNVQVQSTCGSEVKLHCVFLLSSHPEIYSSTSSIPASSSFSVTAAHPLPFPPSPSDRIFEEQCHPHKCCFPEKSESPGTDEPFHRARHHHGQDVLRDRLCYSCATSGMPCPQWLALKNRCESQSLSFLARKMGGGCVSLFSSQ